MSDPSDNLPGSDATSKGGTETRRQRIKFSGPTKELFDIFLTNLLLTIITLGIYRFWARTRVRRYLWSNAELVDHEFEYIGNGAELFYGFLLVTFVVIVPVLLVYSAADSYILTHAPELEPILALLAFTIILFLIGVARYRARGYRLSRTRLRGIRFGQTGSSLAYGCRYLGYMILCILTLGWFIPAKNVWLWSYSINHSFIGGTTFRFQGSVRSVYLPFAVSWLLFLPTLSLSIAHYKSAELKLFASGTQFQSLVFEFDASCARLVRYALVNNLLYILTLGLAMPFIQRREANLIAEQFNIIGEPDYEAIEQSATARPRIGEGLAEAFDFGEV